MNHAETGGGRIRAYLQFIAAVCYFVLSAAIARHAAAGLASPVWVPLAGQAMLVFLLLLGYAAFGSWMDRQSRPFSAQGLPRRPGWTRELGMGLALGWALAVVCVIPISIFGGIEIVLSTQLSAWGWLLVDAAFFALLALGEEVAFRGYGFQRFADAVGPIGASLGYSAIFAIFQALLPGASSKSIAVAVLLNLVLSTAYVRTRALWVSWGINFASKASRALLFGLAVSGMSSHSPVVEGDPMGPFWLTGSGFGLDGTWITFLILLVFWPIVYSVTRELDFRYNAPVIVPGGIAVDLDAAARKQHEAAMSETAPAPPALVQILPATPAIAPQPRIDPELESR